MPLITGHKGTNHITSEDMGALIKGIVGLGSYILASDCDEGNGAPYLDAELVDNNTVRITAGDAIVQGRHYRIPHGGSETLTIDNGTQGMKRNDLIVLRYSVTDGVESMEPKVIKGTPTSGTPQDPAYQDGYIPYGDQIVEVPLFRVKLDGLNASAPERIMELVPSLDVLDSAVETSGWRNIYVTDKIKIYAKVKAGICYVRGESWDGLEIGENWTDITTLPVGYRPDSTQYVGGVKFTTSATATAVGFKINTSGLIEGLGTGQTIKNWGFSTCFPVRY